MRVACLLIVLSACESTVQGPGTSGDTDTASDTSATQDSHSAESVETGWPQVSGEDFAVIDAQAKELRVYWNDGGTISPTVGVGASLPYADGAYMFGDFDGDGLDDLWVAEPEQSHFRLEVYANEGGIWSGQASYSAAVGMNPEAFRFVCGDFDGDGRADLGAFKTTALKMFLFGNNAGTFDFEEENKTVTALSAQTTWVAADVDGNGTDELLALDGEALSVYPVSAMTLGIPLFSDTLPEGYQMAALDLAADGKADLALWNSAALVVRPGDGSAFSSAAAEVFTVADTGVPAGGNLR